MKMVSTHRPCDLADGVSGTIAQIARTSAALASKANALNPILSMSKKNLGLGRREAFDSPYSTYPDSNVLRSWHIHSIHPCTMNIDGLVLTKLTLEHTEKVKVLHC